MKSRFLNIGLIIVVAALGFWAVRIGASLSEANNNIAALDKKLADAQKEDSIAQMQKKQQAVEIANRNAAPITGGPAVGNLVQNSKDTAPADPKAMLAAAKELPPGRDQDLAMSKALNALAAIDPQAAWDMAQSLADDGSGVQLLIQKSILATWSAKDPAKAAAMLDVLATEEDSDSATNTTATIESNWLKQDPVAATQWIESLPAGNNRDSAILGLAAVAGDADMPAAFKWVASMSNVGARGTAINPIVAQWAKTDPVAARDAVMGQYKNNNNGRQAALLAMIARAAPDVEVNPAPAVVRIPAPYVPGQ